METATPGRGGLFGPAGFYKKALLIALPVMAQLLIQNMVSLIDNFMVSGLGDVKMSGVNISGQILFVFMVLLNTICTAGGIFMSQYYGAGDKRGMRQALSFKAVLAAVSIVLYLLVCMAFPRPVLSLMVVGNSQADAILDEAVKYMFLMGFIGIPMAISTICSSSLREIGQVRTPLLISVIATLVNTFFNWVLIYGNLGAPRLEVQGAAAATIIARLTEMTMFLICIAVRRPPFAATPKELVSVDFPLFFRMLKKGSMVLGSEMLWVISETVTTALYNGRGGADVVSGMAAGNVDEPTREGYTFAGWYLDPEFKNAFDAAATYVRPAGSTTTLYAKWRENTPAPEPGPDDNGGNGTDQGGDGTVPAGTDGNAGSNENANGPAAGNGGTNGTAPETRPARTATTSSSEGTVQTASENGSTDAAAPAETTVTATSAPSSSTSGGKSSESSSSESSKDLGAAAEDSQSANAAGDAWKIAVPVVLLVLGLFLILFALKRRKQEK